MENTLSYLILFLTLFVLGVSIWAFFTRCGKNEKFRAITPGKCNPSCDTDHFSTDRCIWPSVDRCTAGVKRSTQSEKSWSIPLNTLVDARGENGITKSGNSISFAKDQAGNENSNIVFSWPVVLPHPGSDQNNYLCGTDSNNRGMWHDLGSFKYLCTNEHIEDCKGSYDEPTAVDEFCKCPDGLLNTMEVFVDDKGNSRGQCLFLPTPWPSDGGRTYMKCKEGKPDTWGRLFYCK